MDNPMIYCPFIAMKTLDLRCFRRRCRCWPRNRSATNCRFPNAAHHEAEVRATFSGVRQPVLEVLMSRSSPGRYSLHEFPKNVYTLRASDGQGHALVVTPAVALSVECERAITAPWWWSTPSSATAPTALTTASTPPTRT